MRKFVRIIIEPEPQKYLILREIRNDFTERDNYNFPGGKVEPEEVRKPHVAAERELREETNLTGNGMVLIYKGPLEFSGEMWMGYWYKTSVDFSKFKVQEKDKCVESAILSVAEMRKENISSAIQIILDKGLIK